MNRQPQQTIADTFEQIANTFEIKVSLYSKKIKIQLKDLVHWKQYGKQYTEDDIGAGKQIHKKVQLQDIFYSFASSRADQTKSEEEGKGITFMKEYVFGTVVKRGDIPCFKIETGGCVTAYTNSFDKRTNREVNYESNLVLQKVKDMSQVEIMGQRSTRQKNQYAKMFSFQIERLKKQNMILKQSMVRMKKEFEEKLIQCQQNLKVQKNKREEICEFVSKNKQIIQEVNDYQKLLQNMKIVSGLTHPFISGFSISTNNVVTYISPSGSWTHHIFNQKIPFDKQYTFKLRIGKTSSRNIVIGIVDYEKQKKLQMSQNTNNAVGYYGAGGYKYPGNIQQGGGYNTGDIVVVSVWLEKKTVKWQVSGALKATHTIDSMGKVDKMFFPYVEMLNQFDSVQWVD